jgi:hypothetical protein
MASYKMSFFVLFIIVAITIQLISALGVEGGLGGRRALGDALINGGGGGQGSGSGGGEFTVNHP